jgi:hypothetical protein
MDALRQARLETLGRVEILFSMRRGFTNVDCKKYQRVKRRRVRAVHPPVDHSHKVRVCAAGDPTSPGSARCEQASRLHAVRLSARASRGAPAPRPGPLASACTRDVRRVMRISHDRVLALELGWNYGRREAQGGRVCRAEAREVEARRGRLRAG